MGELQTLQPMDETAGADNATSDENNQEFEEAEEMMEMPFGMLGITLLCNLTQYAAFLGLTVLIIMLMTIFRPA